MPIRTVLFASKACHGDECDDELRDTSDFRRRYRKYCHLARVLLAKCSLERGTRTSSLVKSFDRRTENFEGLGRGQMVCVPVVFVR